jgi:hypothetical protein
MSMNVSVSHHRSPPGNGKKIIDHQTSNFTQNYSSKVITIQNIHLDLLYNYLILN